jgi:hypothetical protein
MPKYALVIGIQKYSGADFANLTKPVEDAEAIAQILQTHGDFDVTRLPCRWNNEKQTYEMIETPLTGTILEKEIINFFERINSNEALIYFSGHGYQLSKLGRKKAYIVTSDCSVENVEARGIALEDLNNLILESSCSSLTVLLDCCHAGGLLEKSLITRSLTAFNAGHKNYFFATACRSTGNAYEGPAYSLFTAAVLKALNSPSKDGRVRASKLNQVIDDELRGSGQEPVTLKSGGEITIVTHASGQDKEVYSQSHSPSSTFSFPRNNKNYTPTENTESVEKELKNLASFSEGQGMHNLLILDDSELGFIQEPFISDFIKEYWNKIAGVIPITRKDDSYDNSYFDIINQGCMVDWLFAIVPDFNHPLNIDWIFLRPRQAHPWWYGNHPATSNFNGGGSTECLYENLMLIEALSKSDRVIGCSYIPDLYGNNPPKTFHFLYSYHLFRCAQSLSLNSSNFQDFYDESSKDFIRDSVCLGLYGCSKKTLSLNWQVRSMQSSKEWISSTFDLADKVTLEMRLSGNNDNYWSDHFLKISPAYAFQQWMGDFDEGDYHSSYTEREPLIIRTKDDVLFCDPQVSNKDYIDAYFLDCRNQSLKRLGGNGGDPLPTLKKWGVPIKDGELKTLFQ